MPAAALVVHVFTVSMSLRFLRGQARFMRSRGFNLVCLSSPGPEQQPFAMNEGVEVMSLPMERAITPLQDLVVLVRLWRLLRSVRPEIVHSHTPKGGLLGMIAAWLARVPIRIYHMRGLPFQTATGLARRILIGTERLSCAIAHRVICNSHSLRKVAISHAIAPADRLVTLLGGSGNGVDALGQFNPEHGPVTEQRDARARFGIPADASVVAFVGRFTRDKGIPELIDAWTQLRATFPAAHLLLAGPREERDPLPASTEAILASEPSIHLVGQVEDPRAVYAAADVVVLPSHREGFPNVPLEAAAMQRPVVTTRVAGCLDSVFDGVTGALVEAGNPQAIASALAAYLRDPALCRRHGAAGRARVLREFRPEALWEALLQEYERLLRSRPGVRS